MLLPYLPRKRNTGKGRHEGLSESEEAPEGIVKLMSGRRQLADGDSVVLGQQAARCHVKERQLSCSVRVKHYG